MIYSQTWGTLYSVDGTFIGTGYAGNGAGLDNPDMQTVVDHGPLPQGEYTIGAPLDPPDHLGPLAMPLTPDPANEMFGRSGFFFHMDNRQHNHSASCGCIVMPYGVLQEIADGTDKRLKVTA
jgi:hypothetical protein